MSGRPTNTVNEAETIGSCVHHTDVIVAVYDKNTLRDVRLRFHNLILTGHKPDA